MINSWVSKKNSRFCWFDHFGMCETWGALETLAKVGMVTVLRASQCQRNHVGKDGVGIVMWKWSLWSSTHDYTHTHSSPYFQNWWSSSTRVLLTIFSELVISGFSKSRISVYQFLKYVFVIWSTRYTVSPGIWWFSRLPHLTSNGCIVSTNLLGTRNQWERHQRKKQSVVHVWSHTYG